MMSEAESLRMGYAMLGDHDDEYSDPDDDDEFDGFTIEDEDGVVVEPVDNENEWPDDPELVAFFDLYDDGPDSTAEPEGQ
jgi:hypothetical protein